MMFSTAIMQKLRRERTTRFDRKRRGGAVTVIVALASTALLGFAALATDYGLMVAKRNHLQRVCDAAALAGAYDLPYAANASYNAQLTASQNGVPSVTITYPNGTKQIGVAASQQVEFFFGRAIGLSSGLVATRAVAERVNLKGVPGVVPLAITVDDYNAYKDGTLFTDLLIDNNRQAFTPGTVTAVDMRNENSGMAVDQFEETMVTGSENTIILGQQINSVLNASLVAQGMAIEDGMERRFLQATGAPWYDNGTNYTFPNYPADDPRIVTILVADPAPADNNIPLVNVRMFAPVYVDRVIRNGNEMRVRFRILPGRAYSTELPIVIADENTPDTGLYAIRLVK